MPRKQGGHDAPALTGVLETALYVEDVERSVAFYEDVMGFTKLFADRRVAAMSVEEKQVLLLFAKGGSQEMRTSERGSIPPTDGDGHLHVAFAIPTESLPDWERRLDAKNVPIESRYQWSLGGTSLYFRDPDDHVVELVTPGCWAIY